MPSFADFANPPLDEVICGIAFDKISLSLENVLQFWEPLKERFPNIQTAARFVASPDVVETIDEKTFPRIWLVNPEGPTLIQIQDTMLFFNWSRRDGGDDYLRFDRIYGEFCEIKGRFEKFVADLDVGAVVPTLCELTYVNIVPKGEEWRDFSQLSDIFPEVKWVPEEKEYLKMPDAFSHTLIFPLPEDKGKLHVSYRQGRRIVDDTEVVQMQLSAKGLGGDTSPAAVEEWFHCAHEYMVKGFLELTTTYAQNELWGRSHGDTA